MADTTSTSPRLTRKPTEWVHTISIRVNDEQFINADALRATFDIPTFTEAFRWLLSSPEGVELIGKRVRGEI